MIVSIHQPQYFPYLGFFHKLARSDVFVALDTVQFLRRGFQNRAQVKTQHGPNWLTVPVEAHRSTAIAEVSISSTEPWPRRHVSAIRTNYGRASFFDRYASDLADLLQAPRRSLSDLDLAGIRWVTAELRISTPIVLASDLGVEVPIRAPGRTVPRGRRYDDLSGPGGASTWTWTFSSATGSRSNGRRTPRPPTNSCSRSSGSFPTSRSSTFCSAAGPMRRRSWRRPDDRWTRAR